MREDQRLQRKVDALYRKLKSHIGSKGRSLYVNWADVRSQAKRVPKKQRKKFLSIARKIKKSISKLDKKVLKIRKKLGLRYYP